MAPTDFPIWPYPAHLFPFALFLHVPIWPLTVWPVPNATSPVLSGRRRGRRGQRPVGRLLRLVTLPWGQLRRLCRLGRGLYRSDFIVNRCLWWSLSRGFRSLLGWEGRRRMWRWLGSGDLVRLENRSFHRIQLQMSVTNRVFPRLLGYGCQIQFSYLLPTHQFEIMLTGFGPRSFTEPVRVLVIIRIRPNTDLLLVG